MHENTTILVWCSSSLQQLGLGDGEMEGPRVAGVLGGNAIVVRCGKFGFELVALIQDD